MRLQDRWTTLQALSRRTASELMTLHRCQQLCELCVYCCCCDDAHLSYGRMVSDSITNKCSALVLERKLFVDLLLHAVSFDCEYNEHDRDTQSDYAAAVYVASAAASANVDNGQLDLQICGRVERCWYFIRGHALVRMHRNQDSHVNQAVTGYCCVRRQTPV